MNINDVTFTVPPEWQGRPTHLAVLGILQQRLEVFRAFCAVESNKGFLSPPIPLSSAKGQDSARILITRVMEEILESTEADTPDHVLEELIDALNFLLAIPLLDDEVPMDLLVTKVTEVLQGVKFTTESPASPVDVLDSFITYVGPFLESCRNRSWQKHSQSLYFDGWVNLIRFVSYVWGSIALQFSSWDEFLWYHLAKEEVLRFRLRSNY